MKLTSSNYLRRISVNFNYWLAVWYTVPHSQLVIYGFYAALYNFNRPWLLQRSIAHADYDCKLDSLSTDWLKLWLQLIKIFWKLDTNCKRYGIIYIEAEQSFENISLHSAGRKLVSYDKHYFSEWSLKACNNSAVHKTPIKNKQAYCNAQNKESRTARSLRYSA